MNGHKEYPRAKLEMGEALRAGASSVLGCPCLCEADSRPPLCPAQLSLVFCPGDSGLLPLPGTSPAPKERLQQPSWVWAHLGQEA